MVLLVSRGWVVSEPWLVVVLLVSRGWVVSEPWLVVVLLVSRAGSGVVSEPWLVVVLSVSGGCGFRREAPLGTRGRRTLVRRRSTGPRHSVRGHTDQTDTRQCRPVSSAIRLFWTDFILNWVITVLL